MGICQAWRDMTTGRLLSGINRYLPTVGVTQWPIV